MIQIRMWNDKWRLQIGDEVWQFDNKEKMLSVLEVLVEYKDEYGRLGKDRYEGRDTNNRRA